MEGVTGAGTSVKRRQTSFSHGFGDFLIQKVILAVPACKFNPRLFSGKIGVDAPPCKGWFASQVSLPVPLNLFFRNVCGELIHPDDTGKTLQKLISTINNSSGTSSADRDFPMIQSLNMPFFRIHFLWIDLIPPIAGAAQINDFAFCIFCCFCNSDFGVFAKMMFQFFRSIFFLGRRLFR